MKITTPLLPFIGNKSLMNILFSLHRRVGHPRAPTHDHKVSRSCLHLAAAVRYRRAIDRSRTITKRRPVGKSPHWSPPARTNAEMLINNGDHKSSMAIDIYGTKQEASMATCLIHVGSLPNVELEMGLCPFLSSW